MVGGALHQRLHDRMLECLEGCNVTLEMKEDDEGVGDGECVAVMVLGSSIPTAVQVQKQNMGSAFIYCAQVMLTGGITLNSFFSGRRGGRNILQSFHVQGGQVSQARQQDGHGSSGVWRTWWRGFGHNQPTSLPQKKGHCFWITPK